MDITNYRYYSDGRTAEYTQGKNRVYLQNGSAEYTGSTTYAGSAAYAGSGSYAGSCEYAGSATLSAKDLSFDVLIEKFKQGNLVVSELKEGLSNKGVTNFTESENDGFIVVSFQYRNKSYKISCSKQAAESQTDNKTQTTYTASNLKSYYKFSEELITKYFTEAETVNDKVKQYAMKPDCGFINAAQLRNTINKLLNKVKDGSATMQDFEELKNIGVTVTDDEDGTVYITALGKDISAIKSSPYSNCKIDSTEYNKFIELLEPLAENNVQGVNSLLNKLKRGATLVAEDIRTLSRIINLESTSDEDKKFVTDVTYKLMANAVVMESAYYSLSKNDFSSVISMIERRIEEIIDEHNGAMINNSEYNNLTKLYDKITKGEELTEADLKLLNNLSAKNKNNNKRSISFNKGSFVRYPLNEEPTCPFVNMSQKVWDKLLEAVANKLEFFHKNSAFAALYENSENQLYALIAGEISAEEIQEVLESGNNSEFLKSFLEGFQTQLSNEGIQYTTADIVKCFSFESEDDVDTGVYSVTFGETNDSAIETQEEAENGATNSVTSNESNSAGFESEDDVDTGVYSVTFGETNDSAIQSEDEVPSTGSAVFGETNNTGTQTQTESEYGATNSVAGGTNNTGFVQTEDDNDTIVYNIDSRRAEAAADAIVYEKSVDNIKNFIEKLLSKMNINDSRYVKYSEILNRINNGKVLTTDDLAVLLSEEDIKEFIPELEYERDELIYSLVEVTRRIFYSTLDEHQLKELVETVRTYKNKEDSFVNISEKERLGLYSALEQGAPLSPSQILCALYICSESGRNDLVKAPLEHLLKTDMK